MASDGLRRIASDRLLHARGPATAKARSPTDERRVAGTIHSIFFFCSSFFLPRDAMHPRY